VRYVTIDRILRDELNFTMPGPQIEDDRTIHRKTTYRCRRTTTRTHYAHMNRQLLLDVVPATAPTLDNYIAGPNALAAAAVAALAPGHALYLWGAAGSGRSHLLRAAAERGTGEYIGAGTMATRLRELAQLEPSRPLPAIIAIDDVHTLDDDCQAALFALYNRWRESAATSNAFALLLAGDRAPLTLPLREDLRTRLGWDLVIRLEPLSDADKLSALTALATARGLPLGPEVISWMLTHHERDIRRLTALLDALDRYSLATRRPITIPLLRTMLADPDSHSP
jgi:DnaA family protein